MKLSNTCLAAPLALGMLCVSFPADASPPARYRITNLGTLPAADFQSVATGINNAGQIAGFATPNPLLYRPFLLSNGVMQEIPVGTGNAFPTAINDSGQVLGYFFTEEAPRTESFEHVFLYANGTGTDLTALYGASLTAFGLNNHGHCVGTARKPDNNFGGFVYSNGIFQVISIGLFTEFRDINDAGQIVGVANYPQSDNGRLLPRTFILQDGVQHDLGLLPHTDSMYGLSINNQGQVAGFASQGEEPNAKGFVYIHDHLVEVPPLDGSNLTILTSINDESIVVGSSRIRDGVPHAVVWEHGKLTDLNRLIPPNSGWEMYEATCVNNSGQIVGFGAIDGKYRAFLLDPVKPGNSK